MNKENDEINIEKELNELPGYIQSIINDCYTFDKKEYSNKNEEPNNFDSDIENKNINTDNTPIEKENTLNNSISKTNENSNDNNKDFKSLRNIYFNINKNKNKDKDIIESYDRFMKEKILNDPPIKRNIHDNKNNGNNENLILNQNKKNKVNNLARENIIATFDN